MTLEEFEQHIRELKEKDGSWDNTEEITIHEEFIGVAVNNLTGAEANTTVFKIHYSKKRTHIVSGYPSRKGEKAKNERKMHFNRSF